MRMTVDVARIPSVSWLSVCLFLRTLSWSLLTSTRVGVVTPRDSTTLRYLRVIMWRSRMGCSQMTTSPVMSIVWPPSSSICVGSPGVGGHEMMDPVVHVESPTHTHFQLPSRASVPLRV